MSNSEFTTFISEARPDITPAIAASLFAKVDANSDGEISVHEFVDSYENILAALADTPLRQPQLGEWRLWLRYNVVETRWIHKLVFLLIIFDIWVTNSTSDFGRSVVRSLLSPAQSPLCRSCPLCAQIFTLYGAVESDNEAWLDIFVGVVFVVRSSSFPSPFLFSLLHLMCFCCSFS